MKIWFPTFKANSGVDVYTNRLAEALHQYGVDTSVSYFPKYYEFAPFLLSKHLPPTGTDIIHTNSWIAFAFRTHGAPLVATVHLTVMDPSYSDYKSFAQRMYHQLLIKQYEKASIEHADKITTVSDFVGTSIDRTYGKTGSETIYNFVDTDYFRPDSGSGKEEGRPFRLLFIGNLTRRKGSDILGPIMEKLGENFELYATTGLRQHTYSLKGRNIHNIGKLIGENVVRAYQSADALLFPTRLEGFGYCVLEAMACGLPVIASDNSSIPEIVKHNETGILCPTDDINSFVDACKLLANNPEMSRAFGLAGRERAINYFSTEVIIPKYLDLYRRVLDNN